MGSIPGLGSDPGAVSEKGFHLLSKFVLKWGRQTARSQRENPELHLSKMRSMGRRVGVVVIEISRNSKLLQNCLIKYGKEISLDTQRWKTRVSLWTFHKT